ncbi:hypothetical protein NDU88_010056 [Pleurodeles waltl]|uniref:Uncharacterized protein n=1 Tax=Pleurodeles waltl TaxID=8319 RepID=A0AAV7PU29_PLEWA|nr:hypothetical protein NDU88_010056 [Pleurodeles waltl]
MATCKQTNIPEPVRCEGPAVTRGTVPGHTGRSPAISSEERRDRRRLLQEPRLYRPLHGKLETVATLQGRLETTPTPAGTARGSANPCRDY